MKDLLVLPAHLLRTLARLLGPAGARTVVADSLLTKQQLLTMNRSRRRAPNLTPIDRVLLGFWSQFLNSNRIQRAAVIIRPSTLLHFHDVLKIRGYRLLYTSSKTGKPGPKGPLQALIEAIVELKRRNPRFGCPRIAQQINFAFGVSTRTKAFPIHPARTLSLSDSSGPFAASFLTPHYSGMPLIWSGSWGLSKITTTARARMRHWVAAPPAEIGGDRVAQPARPQGYAWEKHWGGLLQLPVAA